MPLITVDISLNVIIWYYSKNRWMLLSVCSVECFSQTVWDLLLLLNLFSQRGISSMLPHFSPVFIQTTSELWWLSGGKEGILSELLHAGLCDTMFTVSSTLMWAFLTGPADWVCHMHRGGCLDLAVLLYSLLILWYTLPRWSGPGRIQALSERPTGFLQCFDTVGLVIWPVKIVLDMTYNVFGGTLNLAQSIKPSLYLL